MADLTKEDVKLLFAHIEVGVRVARWSFACFVVILAVGLLRGEWLWVVASILPLFLCLGLAIGAGALVQQIKDQMKPPA